MIVEPSPVDPGELRRSRSEAIRRWFRSRGYRARHKLRVRAPRRIDVSLLPLAFLALGPALFFGFIVTSTFPLPVKYLLSCIESLAIGSVLLTAALWLRRR